MLNSLSKLFFSVISLFVPVNRNVYIMGSWFGQRYSDNPKYFYQYLLNLEQGPTVYWYTRNRSVYNEMRAAKLPVLYGVSFKVIRLHLRASAVFYSCSLPKDILGFAVNRKAKCLNLWHGTPMKKIGNDVIESGVGLENSLAKSESSSFFKLSAKKILSKPYNYLVSRDVYVLSPSQEVSEILKGAFRVKETNILNLGYPKLDGLFKAEKIKKGAILYVPTYRGEYGSEFNILEQFGFQIDKVTHWLDINDLTLDIKLHPANKLPKALTESINASEKIKVVDFADVYEELSNYSYVVTDFSSIYFDSLVLGITTILAPFGFDSYIDSDRELYFSVKEIFPDKLSYNWDELMTNMQDYKDLQNKKLIHRFHENLDGNSSARLLMDVRQRIG